MQYNTIQLKLIPDWIVTRKMIKTYFLLLCVQIKKLFISMKILVVSYFLEMKPVFLNSY